MKISTMALLPEKFRSEYEVPAAVFSVKAGAASPTFNVVDGMGIVSSLNDLAPYRRGRGVTRPVRHAGHRKGFPALGAFGAGAAMPAALRPGAGERQM